MERSPSRARRVLRLVLGTVLPCWRWEPPAPPSRRTCSSCSDLPDFQSLEDYRPALTTTVLDREGRPIGEFFEQRRSLTPLAEIPPHAVQAFIAAEDGAFYQHRGIDLQAPSIRAAWANLRAGGETVQGASTITQQMVKQLLLSRAHLSSARSAR